MAADDPRQRAWARFVTAQALLIERIEEALAAADLPALAWYDVLWALERAENGQLRMHDLARRTVVSRSNITRLTDRLEKAGLVERVACAEDGRGTLCALTGKGRALRAKMWPVYRAQIDELFGAHLSAKEAQLLCAALDRIIAAARARVQT